MLALTATLLLLTVGAATASASTGIEQVWSFGGGAIAIKPEGTTGKYEGVVVEATTFAACAHPVGQRIWTEFTLQADGSYWGKHFWYKTVGCSENPTRGLTAFRVVETPQGAYLRVCLSEPGNSHQPTIPPGSEGSGSYGCGKSKLISPLPTTEKTGTGTTPPAPKNGLAGYIDRLTLPSNAKCLSSRKFVIHLKDPEHDPFKTVVVTIKGHKIKTVRRGKYILATINLKGYPTGRFTLNIKATTVLGNHLSGKRAYHTCAKKANKSKPKKLK